MSSNYRSKALNEHGEECRICGATEAIQIHHKDGDRSNNSIDNLVPLCVKCHSDVHRSGKAGLEEHLLPDNERTISYQFDINGGEWQAWKNTVPRSKSLETRIIELIEADTEGRVRERDDE